MSRSTTLQRHRRDMFVAPAKRPPQAPAERHVSLPRPLPFQIRNFNLRFAIALPPRRSQSINSQLPLPLSQHSTINSQLKQSLAHRRSARSSNNPICFGRGRDGAPSPSVVFSLSSLNSQLTTLNRSTLPLLLARGVPGQSIAQSRVRGGPFKDHLHKLILALLR